MLHIIISADVDIRIKKRNTLFAGSDKEVIVIEDMMSSIESLEQYIYPSLFSNTTPVVHARYLLEEYGDTMTKVLLKKLISSPTIFILEERSVRTPVIKEIEKEGGIIYQEKVTKKPFKQNTIFAVTNALTATNKKDRWLAYEQALFEHTPEAIIGILYWKLRDLIEKSGAQTGYFRGIYRALMQAHKDAWQKGVPLQIAIEKVILKS